MTKSYIKKVSFKLFLEGVQVRCHPYGRGIITTFPSSRSIARHCVAPVCVCCFDVTDMSNQSHGSGSNSINCDCLMKWDKITLFTHRVTHQVRLHLAMFFSNSFKNHHFSTLVQPVGLWIFKEIYLTISSFLETVSKRVHWWHRNIFLGQTVPALRKEL